MNVEQCMHRALAVAERHDFAGYDPYDALNSPLLHAITARSKWARIAATQALRRSPINLRPLLGIRKGHNPKGVGLFLWTSAKLFRATGEEHYLSKIEYLLELLEQLRCRGYSGNCWGYNFDWQSRTCFRPKGTPTIVNSAFIGHALLDCFEMTGLEKAVWLAVGIQEFLLKDLNRTWLNDGFCFSYTPVDHEVVHNANLLGASLLVRLAAYQDVAKGIDPALASLAFSMEHQREDGSWYYADTPKQKWIDSFHTGFNLQAIRYILREGYAEEFQRAYWRGVEYYADTFFLADGTPKYYHNRVYPIDIHSAAQAVVYFAGMGPGYRELTVRVLTWMLENMESSGGRFMFQKHKHWTNRICYMRWGQAWACHALSEHLLHCQSRMPDWTFETRRAKPTAA